MQPHLAPTLLRPADQARPPLLVASHLRCFFHLLSHPCTLSWLSLTLCPPPAVWWPLLRQLQKAALLPTMRVVAACKPCFRCTVVVLLLLIVPLQMPLLIPRHSHRLTCS